MKIGKMEAEREGQAIESLGTEARGGLRMEREGTKDGERGQGMELLGTGVKRGRYYYIKC